MSKAKKEQSSKRSKRQPRNAPAVPPLETLRSAELVPVKYLPMLQPAFTESSLRWMLFHREENGLVASGAVVQLGRRLLLRPKQFAAWIESRVQDRAAA